MKYDGSSYKINSRAVWITLSVCLLLSLCIGCGGGEADRRAETDRLNAKAYRMRYCQPDTTRHYALQALSQSDGYPDGQAAALDNLAFYAIMRMDFEGADSIYQLIHTITRNELYHLCADVGRMRVCQRTARNKEFYDYRGSALNHIRRIEEDWEVLDSATRARFIVAQADFHIVTSTYYFYLQQEDQSMAAIQAIRPEELAVADTAQWLYYLYMKGSGGLCEGQTDEEVAVREFDYLARCLQVSRRGGYRYFEANAMQGIAALLTDSYTKEILMRNRPVAIPMLLEETDTLAMPLAFARKALSLFKAYGDTYQIAGTYRTIASYLIEEGDYALAVDTLAKALDYVNLHHRTYYQCEDTAHYLRTYNPDEAYPLELEWTSDKQVQTVPEWILSIREQLSLAYSGMDWKEASDYNRNIYLDMLEVVRQDKELENRRDTLEREARSLNLLLMFTAGGLIAVVLLFLLLNRKWKRRNVRQTEQLRNTLEICQQVMRGESTAMQSLAGLPDNVQRIVSPYLTWAMENANRMQALGEEAISMEEKWQMYRHRMAANKRENIVKRACLSIVTGIIPFIDRLMHEAGRLEKNEPVESECECSRRIAYMRELTDKINEYNDLLAGWIKMKQGALKLNIESFPVAELFAIISKSKQGFDKKSLHLHIEPTDLWVKADRALTLFMLNTLLGNARKYTFEGGHVKVSAAESEDGIEIAIEDDGPGIPEEDIRLMMEEKFYDPSVIGRHSENFEELKKQKGHGFGLMNCRGIIEKYRKTSDIFSRCRFVISNCQPHGCRISFVLPPGVRRTLIILFGILMVPIGKAVAVGRTDSLVGRAAGYADQAYYCNVDGRYADALLYIDSVITCLNDCYLSTSPLADSTRLLALTGRGSAAESVWLDEGYDTDYSIILDIRNEASVSFLALRRWEDYRYNNRAYAHLFKLVGRDTSLEGYCRELARSASDKQVGILLCLLLAMGAALVYYLLYLRHHLSYRFHLQQVFEVNRAVFIASEEEDRNRMPVRILSTAWEGINDIFTLDTMALAVCHEDTEKTTYTFFPEPEEWYRFRLSAKLDDYIQRAKVGVADEEYSGRELLLPCFSDGGKGSSLIGVFCIVKETAGWSESDILLARLLAGFISIVIQCRVVQPAMHEDQMELLSDEAGRAHREEMKLHVQNTVLDNCLSTIKHETLYYPNRIRQLLDEVAGEGNDAVRDLKELVSYYRDVFFLLSRYAVRQSEEVAFRRTTFDAGKLVSYAEDYFRKRIRRIDKNGEAMDVLDFSWQIERENMMVTGDYNALCFLLENLLDTALSLKEAGMLQLIVSQDGRFVRFAFHDNRRKMEQHTLDSLFSPEYLQASVSAGCSSPSSVETAYLVCRQIIREHDEYMGHPGCRINAESCEVGKGFTVWFTIVGKELE